MPPKFHLPPGLNNRQVLANLGRLQRDTPGFLLEMTRRYGDLVFFDVPGNPAVLVNHPDHIRHILQDNHKNYSKDTIQYNALAQVTGQGLLTSDGPHWLRQRRLAQPAFAKERLAALDGIVVPAVEKMLARWDTHAWRGELLNVDAEMMSLALEVVGKALFSLDLSQQASKLVDSVLTVLDYIIYQARNPIRLDALFLTPRKTKFKLALSTLDLAVYDMIAARRESGRQSDDLLGMLLAARDEVTRQPMTDQQVRDEVMTILIAGHETVASALTWAWYLLAQNPAEGLKLRQEASVVLSGRTPTTADLPAMPHTGRVFSEALRLYPPAWLITRKAVDSDRLGEYDLPPGTLAIVSPYTVHRHPQFWDEPECFQPGRFANGSQPRFAYIPFGGGPRLCIGDRFAAIEAQLVLAMVSQRYRLELAPGHPVKVDALVTLRPHHGLPVKVVRV